MDYYNEHKYGRTAEINIRLSEFEIPPMQDALLVGRKAPIGPEAARRMVDVLSPDNYDIISLKDEPFEAVVIRKSLLNMIPSEKLVPLILEEGKIISDETKVIKAQINISVLIKRALEL